MRAAWKSIECGILVLLRIVTFTVSPTRTRSTGPGTRSPNVQSVTTFPGAISAVFSVMSSTTRCTAAGRYAGASAEFVFFTTGGDVSAVAAGLAGGAAIACSCAAPAGAACATAVGAFGAAPPPLNAGTATTSVIAVAAKPSAPSAIPQPIPL